ncbi:hypothetical protein Tco_1479520, partial [Tanacetum coccineum]
EEKFYPYLLTTISGRRWLLTHGLKLALVKCLNSQEYLSALGAAISRAIEKGMQDGLSANIVHVNEDFPLLSELSSYKNASVEDIMNLLRLEGPLADAHGMSDLQPNVDQLMLLVYRSKDQVVLGETFLSFALNVTHSQVERIRENVAARRSALICVWAPLVDPLSAENLVGAAGTFDSVPTTVATTTALSTTFASASSVASRSEPPDIQFCISLIPTLVSTLSTMWEDAQGNGQGNVASFPIVEFEKEEMDTTLERDPPS